MEAALKLQDLEECMIEQIRKVFLSAIINYNVSDPKEITTKNGRDRKHFRVLYCTGDFYISDELYKLYHSEPKNILCNECVERKGICYSCKDKMRSDPILIRLYKRLGSEKSSRYNDKLRISRRYNICYINYVHIDECEYWQIESVEILTDKYIADKVKDISPDITPDEAKNLLLELKNLPDAYYKEEEGETNSDDEYDNCCDG